MLPHGEMYRYKAESRGKFPWLLILEMCTVHCLVASRLDAQFNLQFRLQALPASYSLSAEHRELVPLNYVAFGEGLRLYRGGIIRP